jgi:thiol-disulfide isomerase/thioredoxin
MMHFWDALDAEDTVRSMNTEFLEQNFSNFISLFPVADSAVQRRAVESMMERFTPQRRAYKLLVQTARKYLYEPESPAKNEDYYEMVLEAAEQGPDLGVAERLQETTERRWIAKNHVGTLAADFVYRTGDGKLISLMETEIQDNLVLFFYNPDCEHCSEAARELADNEEMNVRIADGDLRVLAVNIYSDEGRSRVDIPKNWIQGVDLSGIEEHELYIVRSVPTIYVLGADHKVLLKDCSTEDVEHLYAKAVYE